MKIGVLFDLDGTLLDTLEDLTDAVNYTMRHYGFPEKDKTKMRRIIGNGTKSLLLRAMGQRAEEVDIQEVLSFYRNYYDAHSCIKTRPYDGIPEALAAVRQKYPVAVVSNKPDPVVKQLSADFFPGVQALGEVADLPRKPAPDMLRKAMADLGVDACVYIGDSEVDVETAANAQVPCLSVLWGFRDKPQIEEVGGKYFCTDVRDLPGMVEKIVGEVYGK